ncbi:MAG TPA: phage tail protein [Candidatus Sumerlaeota bacterium]|nr:phage tail protein [Candidatus Sumerlaeota bacterium]HPL75711.1 phage tail protein [Candidatus Sumerlaeota bacterium]
MIHGEVSDVRKSYRWGIEVEGLEIGYAQKVKIPDVEFAETTHGGQYLDVKTPGRMKFSDIEIEKLMRGTEGDSWAWDKFLGEQDPATGVATPPSEHYFDLYILHYDFDGKTIIDRWLVKGAWVKKIAYSDNDRKSDDNIIETITLAYLYYVREG